jgi:hypothetical protein
MIQHKRGDTFNILCEYKDANNQPIDLTNITVTSQVRDTNDNLIDTLVYTVVDAISGQYTLSAASTPNWVVGKLLCDIQYINGGTTTSTDTFIIDCIKDETR